MPKVTIPVSMSVWKRLAYLKLDLDLNDLGEVVSRILLTSHLKEALEERINKNEKPKENEVEF